MTLPKDSARVNRPKNLNDSEIAAILISTKHIPYEDIEILEETVKIRYPYHPAGGARDTEFQQALDAASAAKEHRETDEEYLPQRCKDYVAKAVLAEFQENQALKEKLKEAETERKQQDILVAELTQKVIDLQSGLSLSEQALDQFREEAARLRTIARALMPYRERQDQIGNIARIAYDILNPPPAPEVPTLREQVLGYLQEQKAGAFPNTAHSASEIAEAISLLHEPIEEDVIEVLTQLANEGLIYTHVWLGADEKRYILAQAK